MWLGLLLAGVAAAAGAAGAASPPAMDGTLTAAIQPAHPPGTPLRAQAPAATAAAGTYPSPKPNQYVYDGASAFGAKVSRSVTTTLSDLETRTGARVVVFTEAKKSSRTAAAVRADAQALIVQWNLDDGAVEFWNFLKNNQAILQIVGGPTFVATRMDQATLDSIVTDTVKPNLDQKDWAGALIASTTYISANLASAAATPSAGAPTPSAPTPSAAPTAPLASAPPGAGPSPGTLPVGPAPPAGPPYPAPVNGVTVYDYASVLQPATIASVTRTIAGIRERTGAEVVVYTQVKPDSNSPALAEQDAIALIDQWGVGRAGFDDGLAILFDLDQSKCHGQVQLYAAPGYRATYLTNEERQAIFNGDMLPYLHACDLDQALLAAMEKVDAAATPEHAQKLQTARQLDAAVGLVLAPLALIGLVGWAGWSWFRYGRDPVYLDDPSILMPAPPPD